MMTNNPTPPPLAPTSKKAKRRTCEQQRLAAEETRRNEANRKRNLPAKQRSKKIQDQMKDLDDLDARKKNRGGSIDKETVDISTTTMKKSERGLAPDATRNPEREMQAATVKDPNATSTSETPLPQHEEGDDDDDDFVSPHPLLNEAHTTKGAAHKEAHSDNKPTGAKLKTMAEFDAEAKGAAGRKKYESQSVGKSNFIREQRLSEEAHDAYYFDIDEEHKKILDEERYAKHCLRLRADYSDKDFIERILALLQKRDWKISNEACEAQLNKELGIKKRY